MTQTKALSELNDDEELESMPSLMHGAIGIRLGRYLDVWYLDVYVEQYSVLRDLL